MTYNVNFTMPGRDQTVEVIRQADADIVCLQETTAEWEKLLRRELHSRYPHIRFEHDTGGGGLGVLSKVRFRTIYFRKPKGAWHPVWAILAATPAGPVQFVNVHLRPPMDRDAAGVYRFTLKALFGSRQVRRGQIVELLGWTDLTRPTVVLGDFNESDRSPAVSFARNEKGLDSATGRFDPFAATWRSSPNPLAIRQRLDHVLYSPHLTCTGARVLPGGGSDHRAVIATFRKK